MFSWVALQVLSSAISHVGISPGDAILEAGTGQGVSALVFSQAGEFCLPDCCYTRDNCSATVIIVQLVQCTLVLCV